MSKKIFLYGTPSKIAGDQNTALKAKHGQSGGNSGNLFIGASVRRHIPEPWSEQIIGAPIDIDALHDNCDMIVIPASNFFNEYIDYSRIINILEKTSLPIVTVGLGAQAKSFNENIKIKKENRRFFEILADRCETIGVRGYFTAECLNNIGIKNVDVIGCPTYFFNARPSYKIIKKPLIDESNIAINFERKKELNHLVKLAISLDVPIIAQNELFELGFKKYREESRKKLINHPHFDVYRHLPYDPEKIYDYINRKIEIFYDIDRWMNRMKRFDFVVGPRLHGNMIALQSGVPALWIQHDSRTTEVTDFLQLPAIHISELKEFRSFAELYNHLEYDKFNKAYSPLYENYVRFLEKNNVPHNMVEPIVTDVEPKSVHEEAISLYTRKKKSKVKFSLL